LPLDLILRRLDDVPTLTTLSLTGGEPSLRPQTLTRLVLPLVRYAKARGLSVQVNTNLTLPWSRYEPLLPWVDVFHTSLNAADAATFVAQALGPLAVGTKAEHLFARLLENIRTLVRHDAYVSVETMLSPTTVPHLLAIHDLIASLGVQRQEVHPLYAAGFGTRLPTLPRAMLAHAVAELLDARSPDVTLLFGTLPFYWCQATPKEAELLRRLSLTPGVHVRNDPDGRNRLNVSAFTGAVRVTDFRPDVVVGDIRTEDLLTVYRRWRRSEAAEALSCRCPLIGCLGPNMLVRAMYYAEATFSSGAGDEAWQRFSFETVASGAEEDPRRNCASSSTS
jgi:radical SAM/CxCxxxxC motif protein YfkAB